ncbi:MAG: diguanylate cyclase [Desulfobacterium sp.]|nr:diguanylate cyclase [Desulfobacterium sp.]
MHLLLLYSVSKDRRSRFSISYGRLFCLFLFFMGSMGVPASVSLAQSLPIYFFEHLDQEDGLPHSTVFQIMQDRHGFIWFATRNGVAKYDGIRMRIFQHDSTDTNSISHNDSGGVLEDRKGYIWVRTWGGGLNRIDETTGEIRVFRYTPGDTATLSEDRVQTFFTDSRGILWAGTFSKGLNRFHPETDGFTRYMAGTPGAQGLSSNRIWSITEMKDGSLWVGTDNGLNRLDVETGQINSYYLSRDDKQSNRIRTLLPGSDGRLWVGTEKGLKRFDPKTGRFTPPDTMNGFPPALFSDAISALYEDDQKILWVGTPNHGLYRVDLGAGTWDRFRREFQKKGTLSNNDVRWIHEDRSGVLWIGTRGGGVNKLSKIYTGFTLHESIGDDDPCPGLNTIHALADDGVGGIWSGTWYNGLNRIQEGEGCTSYGGALPEGPGSMAINALYGNESGGLFVGTWEKGLLSYDRTSQRFSRLNPGDGSAPDIRTITALAQDHQGRIWAGSREQGLFRHDPATGDALHIPEINGTRTVSSLLVDSVQNLWVGTDAGLFHLGPDGSTLSAFTHSTNYSAGLSNQVVTSLALGNQGCIWVGTYQGLSRLDPSTGIFRQYTQKDGLAGELIKAVVADGSGTVWISTDRGISRLDPGTHTIRNFDFPLVFNQGAALISFSRDRIIFGGETGYLSFDPRDVVVDKTPPPMVLSGISLHNKPVLPGTVYGKKVILHGPVHETDQVTLSHNDNSLSIAFALLDFNSPLNTIYSYRLEGCDTEWRTVQGAGANAHYSDLSPGEYTFRVTGTSSMGKKNDTGASLAISITPPFWERWYFRLGLLGSILLLVCWAIYLRFSRETRKNKMLTELVNERTKELLEQKQQLEHLSRTDPLTGLNNRRGFLERVGQEIHHHRRTQKSMSFILCDVDDFKILNDTHGHDCGDYVLETMGSLLPREIRGQDILGRWGGEEFILLLPESDPDGAVLLVRRIQGALASQDFSWKGKKLSVTMTYGISLFSHKEGLDASVAKADKALYRGKQQGKNCAVIQA